MQVLSSVDPVPADIDGWGRLGDAAYGDEIDAGFGDDAYGLSDDAA